ncbi:hypothetical protein Tsubulata_017401 [Turnera subulata]|uniref:Tyrosinase copper-binding domain-containing protein n=1 Tax=Turnera subulata TaxID=218843 RepID=A0A9Q0G7N6_9ROSI|nr:hypothetical protein Tsubulata_017401 [Turnera subulata]
MKIPAIYTNTQSSLYDPLREKTHQPPALLDLDFNGTDELTSTQNQMSSNLAIMYRQMVSGAKTTRLFFGEPYRAGGEPEPGFGSIENTPHGPVHRWTGDLKTQEDMGVFYSAARDPIFYAHHANVDRMWTIWKTLPKGRRTEFTDRDWLEASFLFYDENANPVRVKVKDCLDNRKLGYVYQDVDIPWLKAKPKPKKLSKKLAAAATTNTFGRGGVALAAEKKKKKLTPASAFPLVLDKVISTQVPRPRKSRSKKEKEEEEEVLVIDGIEYDKNEAVKFNVYVNDEDDESPPSPDNTEFAGGFVNVPHKHGKKKGKTCLRLGLTDLLEDLGSEDDDTVVVTLVPKYGQGLVNIGGIKIEFLKD